MLPAPLSHDSLPVESTTRLRGSVYRTQCTKSMWTSNEHPNAIDKEIRNQPADSYTRMLREEQQESAFSSSAFDNQEDDLARYDTEAERPVKPMLRDLGMPDVAWAEPQTMKSRFVTNIRQRIY
jgi:hypothetical protein